MIEFLQVFTVPANGSVETGVPAGGIAGVYSSGPITIGWDYNGFDGDLVTGVIWEPMDGFHPAPTSKMIFTNNTAVDVKVSVRCFQE